MDLLALILLDDAVHEVEELQPSAAFVMPPVTWPVPTSSAANKVVVPFRL